MGPTLSEHEELQRRRDELAQQLEALEAQMAAVEAPVGPGPEVARLERDLAVLHGRIEALETELFDAEEKIKQAKEDLARIRAL